MKQHYLVFLIELYPKKPLNRMLLNNNIYLFISWEGTQLQWPTKGLEYQFCVCQREGKAKA